MRSENSVQKRLKFAKRLKVVDSFRKSTNQPNWMINSQLPISNVQGVPELEVGSWSLGVNAKGA
jgi:DNA-directed RNA polymerase beta' subunit